MATVEAVTVRVDLDPWMSLSGLAGYSGLGVRTLRALLKHPATPLPHYRVGTPGAPGKRGAKVLVRRSEFDRWMAGWRQQPVSARDVGSILDRAVREVAGRVGGTRDNRRGKAKPRKGTGPAARGGDPGCTGVAPEAGSRGATG